MEETTEAVPLESGELGAVDGAPGRCCTCRDAYGDDYVVVAGSTELNASNVDHHVRACAVGVI